MKKYIKKSIISFMIFIIIIVIINKVYAVINPTVSAMGGYEIFLEKYSELGEYFDNWIKYIRVDNSSDSAPCYVRIKAFAPSYIELVYSDFSDKWKKGKNDDYWYYTEPIAGGECTEEICIKIKNVPEDGEFNVAVISETTDVRYNADGTPYYNWDFVSNRTVN